METVSIDNYERGPQIGSGSFGVVEKAIRKRDQKVIALKIIDIPSYNQRLKEMIDEEVITLKKLSFPKCHPFIVCYYDGGYDEKNMKYLIEMELIKGRDMFDFVQDKSFTNEELYYYLLLIASDVSRVLKHVHSENILHNDIKLENIMIEKDTNIPKLIDFGLACNTHHTISWGDACTKVAGTPRYVAPEFLGDVDGLKLPASDMWALGVALYTAVKGEYPYLGTTKNKLFNEIKNDPVPLLKTNNLLLNDVVNGLLEKDPKKRLKPDQVIKMVRERNKKPEALSIRQKYNIKPLKRQPTPRPDSDESLLSSTQLLPSTIFSSSSQSGMSS